MALLGAMAFKALKGSHQDTGRVPLGLLEPQSEDDQRELEQHTELVLRAMINAAKADGEGLGEEDAELGWLTSVSVEGSRTKGAES